jgi:hypothetical protein
VRKFAAAFEDSDEARDLGRKAQLTAKAALAYIADSTLEATAALVEAAVAGSVPAIKLMLEMVGAKPMAYRAPERIAQEIDDGIGSQEELEAILADAEAYAGGEEGARAEDH